jgi:hypothetical protein
MAEDEGSVMLGAEVGEPVPAEDALDADDQVVAIGLEGPEEEVGLAVQVVQEGPVSVSSSCCCALVPKD